ncbi:MAG: LysR family transcriptional regulator [Pseudomonadota bacterium]
MSLPSLRSFSTVARLGGISAAAERLGMAKSGVSRHVAQLEAHLGVRLLERTARSVKLTPVGEQLAQRIRSILAEVDLLDDIAREDSVGVSGQVSIAATPEFGGMFATSLFPQLKEQHPNLKLIMRTGYAFEDMQDPGTDIAVRVGTFKDDRLVARQFGSFRARLVASPEFLAANRVHEPSDLTHVQCLVFRGDQAATTWTLQQGDLETAVEVSGAFGVQNLTVLLQLAIGGQGVAFLPEFMLSEAIVSGTLELCLPDHASRPLAVYLAYRPGARRVARVDAVLSAAEVQVRALLPE